MQDIEKAKRRVLLGDKNASSEALFYYYNIASLCPRSLLSFSPYMEIGSCASGIEYMQNP